MSNDPPGSPGPLMSGSSFLLPAPRRVADLLSVLAALG